LTFAFADSPEGGKGAGAPDGSGGRAYLLLRAKGKTAVRLAARAADTSRLLEQAASEPNLARALLNVARNKGAPGLDGQTVQEVVAASPTLLPKLRRALLSGNYRPGDVRRVWIPKPDGGQRGLGVPNVADRWVQQALLQVLEPVYDPTFHPSSHGFRARRGAHTAVQEAKAYIRQGNAVVVDIDLSQFFDRVHHQRLLARLAERIADRRILSLIRSMLKAKVVMPDGTRVATVEGTPQGGPLSPLLANIVLDEWDWELERRGLRFVRYADDSNIFVRSERAGHRVMDSMRRFLKRRLRLAVNEEKSSVTRPDALHFLGFRFRPTEEGPVEIHISRKAEARVKALIRDMTPRTWGQSLSSCIGELNQYLTGWAAYFRLCTEPGARLFQVLDAHIRRRLRMIILHQKKRRRFLYRHLLARDVSPQAAAGTAYSRRGIWHRSNRPGVQQAYPNAWFHARMVSVWNQWRYHNPPVVASGQSLLFDL
jgi:group II intron reverse transcriptase/maturase